MASGRSKYTMRAASTVSTADPAAGTQSPLSSHSFEAGGGGFPSLLGTLPLTPLTADPSSAGRAYLKEWSLILYGTSVHPDRRKKKARLPTNRVAVGMRTPVKTPRPPPAPGTVRRDPDSRVPPDPFANTIEDELISNSRNAHHSGSGM